MRGTGQISGDWSLDDIKTAMAEVLAADRAADQVVDPAVFDISRMPAGLKAYWLTGAGAAKIRWGKGGDFDRCCRAINAEITKHGRLPRQEGDAEPVSETEAMRVCDALGRRVASRASA